MRALDQQFELMRGLERLRGRIERRRHEAALAGRPEQRLEQRVSRRIAGLHPLPHPVDGSHEG